MQTSSIARTSKIYPNWDVWFENIPSGNPALDHDPNSTVFVYKFATPHFAFKSAHSVVLKFWSPMVD
jgi:hypothetical protein